MGCIYNSIVLCSLFAGIPERDRDVRGSPKRNTVRIGVHIHVYIRTTNEWDDRVGCYPGTQGHLLSITSP